MLDEGMEKGESSQRAAPEEVGGNTGRSVRDRELELKGMLLECREKKREVQKEIEKAKAEDASISFGPLSLRTDVDTQKRLEDLRDRFQALEDREQEIISELDRLQS